MLKEANPSAETVLRLLKMNGGNRSGYGIACVSWDGELYPDQFWRNRSLGNVRQRKFSLLWNEARNPSLAELRRQKKNLVGRCSGCRFLDACGGNLRARAEAITGDAC